MLRSCNKIVTFNKKVGKELISSIFVMNNYFVKISLLSFLIKIQNTQSRDIS